jgi:cytoskeletal protein RodZ
MQQSLRTDLLEISGAEPFARRGTLGQTLRHERLARGVSVEEIYNVTKIKIEMIEALEADDHETLPAPVFVQGFIKAIGQYLELPTRELLTIYNAEGPTLPVRVMTNKLLIPRLNWWRRFVGWLRKLLRLE